MDEYEKFWAEGETDAPSKPVDEKTVAAASASAAQAKEFAEAYREGEPVVPANPEPKDVAA